MAAWRPLSFHEIFLYFQQSTVKANHLFSWLLKIPGYLGEEKPLCMTLGTTQGIKLIAMVVIQEQHNFLYIFLMQQPTVPHCTPHLNLTRLFKAISDIDIRGLLFKTKRKVVPEACICTWNSSLDPAHVISFHITLRKTCNQNLCCRRNTQSALTTLLGLLTLRMYQLCAGKYIPKRIELFINMSKKKKNRTCR